MTNMPETDTVFCHKATIGVWSVGHPITFRHAITCGVPRCECVDGAVVDTNIQNAIGRVRGKGLYRNPDIARRGAYTRVRPCNSPLVCVRAPSRTPPLVVGLGHPPHPSLPQRDHHRVVNQNANHVVGETDPCQMYDGSHGASNPVCRLLCADPLVTKPRALLLVGALPGALRQPNDKCE